MRDGGEGGGMGGLVAPSPAARLRTRAASTDSIVLLKYRYGAVPEAQVVTPLPEGNIRPQLDNFCHQSFFVKGLHRLHV